MVQAGTYFYHGYYGMQRSAGLYGSLIVDVAKDDKEPFQYDDELNLLLSDWWHQSVHHQEVGLSSKPMKWIKEPKTILINGRGQYGCSLEARYGQKKELSPCKIEGGEQWAPYILKVDPGKTYKLRIASTTALAALNLAIGNHKMKVVEADGNYVKEFETDKLDIYSGESYSVLVTTDQNPSQNYWISVRERGRKPETPRALTLLDYKGNSPSEWPLSPPPDETKPAWDDYDSSKAFSKKILALDDERVPEPPKTYDRRIVLLNTQNKFNDYTKWAINNVSLKLPATPYPGSIRFNIENAYDKTNPPENFPADYDIMKPPPNPNCTTGNGVYMIRDDEKIVHVILQNANMIKDDVSEIHPWHLHGHDFWVLGYGEGKFSKADEDKLNLEDPPYRNTAVIFPYGWTALRFKADNPGVWAFHCHIEPHLHMGMGVVFAERVQEVDKIPKEALACGLTGKKLMTGNNLV